MHPTIWLWPFLGKSVLQLSKVTRDFWVLPFHGANFIYLKRDGFSGSTSPTLWMSDPSEVLPTGHRKIKSSKFPQKLISSLCTPVYTWFFYKCHHLKGLTLFKASPSCFIWRFCNRLRTNVSGHYTKWARISSLVFKGKAGGKCKEWLRVSQKSLHRARMVSCIMALEV